MLRKIFLVFEDIYKKKGIFWTLLKVFLHLVKIGMTIMTNWQSGGGCTVADQGQVYFDFKNAI